MKTVGNIFLLTSENMILLILLFSTFMIACQYQPFTFKYFAATIGLMLALILYQDFKKSSVIVFLIISLSFVTLAYQADYRHTLLAFNSSLYPVSIYDYWTLALATYFGYLCTVQRLFLTLQFLELFACCSAFFITLGLSRWLATGTLPVYSNYNWLGALIVAFSFISLNALFRNSFLLSVRLFIKKRMRLTNSGWILVKCLLLLWTISVNAYLLLAIGSRSAAVTFIIGVILSITFYAYWIARQLRTKFLIIFTALQTGLLMLVIAFLPVITSSRFYARLTQFLEHGNPVRSHIYTCYFNLFRENFLTGAGIGRSAQLCEVYVAEVMNVPNNPGHVNHAHNFILQIAGNHGVIVLLASLSIIMLYVLKFLKFANNLVSIDSVQQNKEIGVVFHIYLTVFALGFISLFQSAVYHVPFLQIWLGLLIGISVAATNSLESSQPHRAL